MPTNEVKVPDIGDFKEIEVIEGLVKPGDYGRQGAIAHHPRSRTRRRWRSRRLAPAPCQSIKVKVGDKVSKGSPILLLDSPQAKKSRKKRKERSSDTQSIERRIRLRRRRRSAPAPVAIRRVRAADLGLRTVLVERYPVLGGVCLNVGCIPIESAAAHRGGDGRGARPRRPRRRRSASRSSTSRSCAPSRRRWSAS
jgi:dihydrolipoamide dehydrogenase